MDPLAAMPEKADQLLPAEKEAYEALVAATHVRAEEQGERWVWNIAMSRSLCEMVRRLPASLTDLRECWGFGGSGVRAQRHGDFLLGALRPHVPALRAAHAATRGGGAAAPGSRPPRAESPRGKGKGKKAAVVKQDDDASDGDDDEDAPLVRRHGARRAALAAPDEVKAELKELPEAPPAVERRRTRVSRAQA